LGNAKLLPEGPLRESAARLDEVDAVLINGHTSDEHLARYDSFQIQPEGLVNVVSGETCELDDWQAEAGDSALAAIGNPERFEQTLSACGIPLGVAAFADHYALTPSDLAVDAKRVIMTEKDAVKCLGFNDSRLWYLAISAKLPESFLNQLDQRLERYKETEA